MTITILLTALAMVESGTARHPNGDDYARGEAGEQSRYQITPAVWAEYRRKGERPTVKAHAARVAGDIIEDRVAAFKAFENREPTPAEIYALWHRPGKFAYHGYRIERLSKIVQARCKRFAKVCAELEKKGVK